MRVIAGVAKGRRLRAPRGTVTRPTSDAVREAIFNVLAGTRSIEDEPVLDLFAGSGALGLEALSRGASHATFVENDRRALDAIRANLQACGFTHRATVLSGDVLRVALPSTVVAFADPPYAFDAWGALLTRLEAEVVVAESAGPVPAEAGWRVLRQKQYGGTVVTLLASRSCP